MHLFFRFAFALFTLIFAAALAHAETLAIGALAELSGNFARFGEDCRRGYQIAGSQFTDQTRTILGITRMILNLLYQSFVA